MARIASCPQTSEACDSADCKIGLCNLEIKERQKADAQLKHLEDGHRQGELAANEYFEKHRVTERMKVAREHLRKEYGRAKEDLVALWSCKPNIIVEADERLRARSRDKHHL